DGGIYVADFYEQRIDHSSHYQGRIHKESGRIYRLRGIGVSPVRTAARSASEGKRFDLSKETPEQLVAHLSDSNKWFRQAARRELLIRGNKSINSDLRPLLLPDGQAGLESLWALNIES